MTTTQETVTEATREAIGKMVHFWADSAQKLAGMLPTLDGKVVPTAEEVVDDWFNFYSYVLATQREYLKSLLAAAKSVSTNAAWATQGTATKKA